MTEPHDEWTVVETLGTEVGIEPSIIAIGTTPRRFVRLERRLRQPRGKIVTDATLAAVETARITGRSVEKAVGAHGHGVITVHAHPILGPDDDVYGVEVWAGDGPPPPRLELGTFDHHCLTEHSRQGNNLEAAIHGSTGPNTDGELKAVPDIWRYFEDFPSENEYMRYVAEVKSGDAAPGETYDAPIKLKGEDQVHRLVHMSTRGIDHRIVGIVHFIRTLDDSEIPKNRTIARAIAGLSTDGTAVAHMNLATGLILDWLHAPTGNYQCWTTDVPELDPHSRRRYAEARDDLATGRTRAVDLTLFLRFDDTDDFHPASITLTSIGPPPDPTRSTGHRLTEGLVQLHAESPPTFEVGLAW